MLKSVSFDAARTLFYAEDFRPNWKLLSEYLIRQGLELYPQELEAARNYVFMVDLPRMHIDNWYDWCAQILVRLDHPNIPPEIIPGMIEILQPVTENYKLYDDVIEFFSGINELGLTYSIVTTIPEFKLQPVLSEIRSNFIQITHGGNAGCVKGNPKMYWLDLKEKDVLPDENIFVGDNPYLDIEIPKMMGQQTVHIDREHQQVLRNSRADFTITSFHQLSQILQQLVDHED